MSFNIFRDHMSNEIGFLRKVLSIFEKYKVSIEHIPSGIDSISVVCSKESCENYYYEIISDIKRELEADVTLDEDIALVAIVGRNMVKRSGLCGKVFTILGNSKINVKL